MSMTPPHVEAFGREWARWTAGWLRTGLWVLAVVLFGVGDLVTTTALIHTGGSEASPVYQYLFMYFPASVALATAVGAQLVIAYVVYRVIDHPARILIPLWLALYGTTVALWNLTYLASLSVPT